MWLCFLTCCGTIAVSDPKIPGRTSESIRLALCPVFTALIHLEILSLKMILFWDLTVLIHLETKSCLFQNVGREYTAVDVYVQWWSLNGQVCSVLSMYRLSVLSASWLLAKMDASMSTSPPHHGSTGPHRSMMINTSWYSLALSPVKHSQWVHTDLSPVITLRLFTTQVLLQPRVTD